jgi:hypothetical protein
MNRINSMGLGFNVSVRSDSSETSKFEMSADVVKQGMMLVFGIIHNNLVPNMLSVMKYGTYADEGQYIANIYKNLTKKGKFNWVNGEFYSSNNPKLQREKIQRSFKRSISYTRLTDEQAQELKKDAKLLSSFKIENGEVVFSGPDKPNIS